jgi:hypothetical protein
MSDPLPPLTQLDPPVLGRTRLTAVAIGLVVLGLAGLGWLASAGGARLWSGLLAGMMLPLWIGLGALFFLAAHSVCGAAWPLPFRRLIEGLSGGVLVAAVVFLAIAGFGIPYLYDWAEGNPGREHLFRDPHGMKAAWMSSARWIASGLIILAVWLLLRWRLLRAGRDPAAGDRHRRWSVAMLIVLVPTLTLFAWDTLLALHVTFTSSLFGGYCLVAAVQAFLAALVLVVVWLGQRRLAAVTRPHLRNDLGTWMVGWACIVAYIAFAQYVIIAFANLDEETAWYLIRSQHGYGTQYAVEALLRCVVPFALLLPQRLRVHPGAQAAAALSALAGTWLDLHWLVVPAFSPNAYRLPVAGEFLVALGCLGALILVALAFWRRHGLVPANDPGLLPAINGEHRS